MKAFFTYQEGSLLLRLIIAHLLTDFFLQQDRWVKEKKEKNWTSKYLWLHGLLTGIVVWILLWDNRLWWAALSIALIHTVIDGLKNQYDHRTRKRKDPEGKTEFRLFVIDQLCHLLALFGIWLLMIRGWDRLCQTLKMILPDYRILLRMAGYLIILEPVGYFIGFFTKRWSKELNMQDSLKDAGKWIGMMERLLILTLVYIGQFAAIGFLIAAKSLLRVIDKPDSSNKEPGFAPPFSPRKHTEYVLIGTFLSFAISLGIGLLVNYLLTL